MIEINRDKCVKCNACVKDCAVHVLSMDEKGFPTVPKGNENYCMNCQHCLAVCPAGALVCNGVGPAEAREIEPIPDSSRLAALLRQRKSIRQWRDEPIADDVWARLTDTLKWMPTGCNDHRLHFSIVRERSRMDELRREMMRTLQKVIAWKLPKILFPKYRRFMEEVERGEDVVFRNAPYMIVAATPKNAPCREADPWIALSYFDLLARSCGLGTCWCGFGVHALKAMPKFRRALGIPKDYEVGAVMLFGPPAVDYVRVPLPPECATSLIRR